MGIRSKLILPLLMGFLALASILHFYWLPQYLNNLRSHFNNDHTLLANSLSPRIIQDLISGDLASLYSMLDTQLSLHKDDWEKLIIIDSTGNMIYPLSLENTDNDKNAFEIKIPLEYKTKNLGSLYLYVDWESKFKSDIKHIRNIEIIILFITALVILISVYWQGLLIRDPLLKLTSAIKDLASGNFDIKLPKAGKDEIGQLCTAFHSMQNALKNALDEAKKSEAHHRAAINTINDAVIIINTKGIIQSFNPAAEYIFGYDYIDVIGKNIKMLMPDTVANQHDKYLAQYLKTKTPHLIGKTLELEAKRSNGDLFYIELTVAEMDLEDDLLFCGVIRDISQKKRDESALRLAATAFNTHEGILITNSDNNIIKVNSAFTEITGYSEEEVAGANPKILSSGRHDDAFYKNIWLTLDAKKHWSGEIWNKRKDGEIYPEWLAITAVLNQQNEVTHYVGNFLDISEEKTQQLLLQQKADELEQAKNAAEAATKAKSDFLATMSHEIRTPMNGVLGMAQILADTDLSPQQREYLDTIEKSGELLLNIINDILDFSKIEADKMTLESIPFNMEELSYGVIKMLSVNADKKGIETIFHYANDCPQNFLGDPSRIRQILVNFIGNAIKFTEQGHVLLDVSCSANDNNTANLIVKVSDSGIGLSQVQKAKLFSAFTQADGSTTRKYGGTGLGLAIAKKLVDLMQGSIGVESEVNQGATFWFEVTLPLSQQIEPLPLADLSGSHALVVDDNELNLQLISQQLASFGMTFDTCLSPQVALIKLQQASSPSAYQLIILDYMMPEMNGEMLAREIRQLDSFQKTPLVLLSSNAHHGDATYYKNVGFNAFLTKPVRNFTFCQTLEAVLGLSKQGVNNRFLNQYTVDDCKKKTPKNIKINAKILLAEDDPTNQKVASSILTTLGAHVDIANNGVEVLELLAKHHYDLVLMDCRMPVMDGFEATQKLRQQTSYKQLPVIALTANVSQADKQHCLDAGMNDFLGKPFKVDDITLMLQKYLSHTNIEVSTVNTPDEPVSQNNAVDQQQLASLKKNMGDFFKELIPGYIQDMETKIEKINQCLEEKNIKELHLLAHSIKGSSSNIGAMPLSHIASTMESYAQNEQANELVDVIVELKSEYERVKSFLQNYSL